MRAKRTLTDGLNELLNNTNNLSNKNIHPKRIYKKWQTLDPPSNDPLDDPPSNETPNDNTQTKKKRAQKEDNDDPKENDNGSKDDEVLNEDLDDDFHHHPNEDLNDDDYHSNEDGFDNEESRRKKLNELSPLNLRSRPESRTNSSLDYINRTSRLARLIPLRSMDNSINVLPNALISSHFNTIGQVVPSPFNEMTIYQLCS
ncbi:10867_t:CDS:2 [Funneliformis geosporum]|nr:10867_t:CDS:2 [Funneliformis geosporum]